MSFDFIIIYLVVFGVKYSIEFDSKLMVCDIVDVSLCSEYVWERNNVSKQRNHWIFYTHCFTTNCIAPLRFVVHTTQIHVWRMRERMKERMRWIFETAKWKYTRESALLRFSLFFTETKPIAVVRFSLQFLTFIAIFVNLTSKFQHNLFVAVKSVSLMFQIISSFFSFIKMIFL